jgi:hypothetical protein
MRRSNESDEPLHELETVADKVLGEPKDDSNTSKFMRDKIKKIWNWLPDANQSLARLMVGSIAFPAIRVRIQHIAAGIDNFTENYWLPGRLLLTT